MKNTNSVLITGGADRIGHAIAEFFAVNNWNIVIHYLNSELKAQGAVQKINESGGKAVAIKADLSQEKETSLLIDKSTNLLGSPLTCLVNNASAFENDSVSTASSTTWNRHLEINLHAPFILSQKFSAMIPPKIEGNIINMLDQRVWNLSSGFTSYTISKSALWTLTQTMAIELAPKIRVNGIGPGPVFPSERQSENHFLAQANKTLLGRKVDVKDVVSAIKFLINTPAITGQMIAVDSGQHLSNTSIGIKE